MDIFVINIEHSNCISSDLLSNFGCKIFSNINKQRIHRFSYLMLDRILKDVYKLDERTVILNEKGKPILKNGKKSFSISHCNKYIVLAFSDYKCGIDIEEVKERNYKKISDRMGFNSSSLKEFYLDWTQYEAEYKLGTKARSIFKFGLPNYFITAVSESKDEIFNTYYNS